MGAVLEIKSECDNGLLCCDVLFSLLKLSVDEVMINFY